jgi:hypothetical protein
MRAMRGAVTKCSKPKGSSKAADADAHQEAEVAAGASVEAPHSTWEEISPIYPQHTDEEFQMLHREAVFPRVLAVTQVAQHDHQHSYHQRLLPPMADRTEDSTDHRSIAAQLEYKDRCNSHNSLIRTC